MLTLPAILDDYARGLNGGGYVYALEILPSAPDGWSAKRYSTNSVTIDGDEYNEAIAKDFTRIAQKARIVQAGGAATMPDLTVKLINKNSLHEDFVVDNVVNRTARLLMTAISSNCCLNSSFESDVAGVPDDWTMHASGLGGVCAQSSAQAHDGTNSCIVLSTNGTEGSWIETTVPIRMLIGERLWLSGYFLQTGGADEVLFQIKGTLPTGGTVYYNASTRLWQFGPVKNSVGTTGGTWLRFEQDIMWSELYAQAFSPQPEYIDITLELWTLPNEGFYADAIQIENWPNVVPTAYHHNRHELTEADDCVTVFTGIIKRPKWKGNEVQFQLGAKGIHDHDIIPRDVIIDAYSWVIPRDSLGRPYPMTYGNFTGSALSVWSQQDESPMARGILTNVAAAPTDGVVVFFDRPAVALYHPAGTYRLYHWHPDNGFYYERMNYDDAGYSYDAIEWLDDLAANAKFKESANHFQIGEGKFAIMAMLRAKRLTGLSQHGGTPDWNNTVNMRDGDLTSFSHTRYSAGLVTYGGYLETYPFANEKIMMDTSIGGKDWCVFLVGRFYFTQDAVAGTATITAGLYSSPYISGAKNIMSAAAPGTGWNNLNGPALLTAINARSIASGDTIPAELRFSGSVDITTTAGTGRVEISEFGALLYVLLPLEESNYAAQLYGRTFQDTWGGRKTATNLAESPAEVIESILRMELGITATDIDTTEFDAVDTARALFKVAGQLHELCQSISVFDEICREFACIYYLDELGKHSLIALDYVATPDDTLEMGDFLNPYTNVQISQTPRESVINDIRVFYDKD